MKVLVTGGAGFIGSHFIRYMAKKYPQYQLINLDLLTYAGNLMNVFNVEKHPNYYFIQGDICNVKLIDDIVSGKNAVLGSSPIDVIINFAAESHVDRSIREPATFVRTNIGGTQILLDAARNYGVKRFVQVSTDEVYGSLGESGYFTEKTPLAPNSPYSASKAGADLLVLSYYSTYKVPVNITRCSNNYGPNQFPEKLIPLTITNALQNKELPIYGDGLHVRDWLHVQDHCTALDLIIHHGRIGEVYNIGSQNEWGNLPLVKKILSIVDKPETLIRFVPDRPGHDRRYAMDATKLRDELGWKPQYSFESGLVDTVNWYVDNKEWWKDILDDHN